jgi:hypothetical protein
LTTWLLVAVVVGVAVTPLRRTPVVVAVELVATFAL